MIAKRFDDSLRNQNAKPRLLTEKVLRTMQALPDSEGTQKNFYLKRTIKERGSQQSHRRVAA
jgi:hypothetical protein